MKNVFVFSGYFLFVTLFCWDFYVSCVLIYIYIDMPMFCFRAFSLWDHIYNVNIVHCSIILSCFSAGVGRTGTYIALDYLIAQAAAEDQVDVFMCVKTLRQTRHLMVQTLASILLNSVLVFNSFVWERLTAL